MALKGTDCFCENMFLSKTGSTTICSQLLEVTTKSKMIDDCSGVAGRTSRCNEKAEIARECPDLTNNFDQCWAAIQVIVFH